MVDTATPMILKARQKYVTEQMNAGATFLGVEDETSGVGHVIALTVANPTAESTVRRVYSDGSFSIGPTVGQWMDHHWGRGRWA